MTRAILNAMLLAVLLGAGHWCVWLGQEGSPSASQAVRHDCHGEAPPVAPPGEDPCDEGCPDCQGDGILIPASAPAWQAAGGVELPIAAGARADVARPRFVSSPGVHRFAHRIPPRDVPSTTSILQL